MQERRRMRKNGRKWRNTFIRNIAGGEGEGAFSTTTRPLPWNRSRCIVECCWKFRASGIGPTSIFIATSLFSFDVSLGLRVHRRQSWILSLSLPIKCLEFFPPGDVTRPRRGFQALIGLLDSSRPRFNFAIDSRVIGIAGYVFTDLRKRDASKVGEKRELSLVLGRCRGKRERECVQSFENPPRIRRFCGPESTLDTLQGALGEPRETVVLEPAFLSSLFPGRITSLSLILSPLSRPALVTL